MTTYKKTTAGKRTASASKTGGRYVVRSTNGRFVVPKGNDIRSVTRDATRQVIKHYGDTLDKLRDR